MTKSIYDVLEEIRAKYSVKTDIGSAFEEACVYFLRNSPGWSRLLQDVKLWKYWELRDGQDMGVDLVARDRNDGTYWAIQCKCYEPNKVLDYKDVATFFSTSYVPKYGFAHHLLITTDCKISKNLERYIESCEGKAVHLSTAQMEQSGFDWSAFLGNSTLERESLTLRPDQIEAINAVLGTLQTHDRTRMIMACGTGKTFVSLKIAETLAPRGTVLFCAPSIALVSQSCNVWNKLTDLDMQFLVVCSDSKASKITRKSNDSEDQVVSTLADLPYPATTNAQTLFNNFQRLQANFKVIFTTYQSIEVISEAQKLGLPAFDLVICDEAHRTAGASFEGEDPKVFQLVHENEIIQAKKRLYMTATPKIYTNNVRESKRSEPFVLCSMDNEAIYGPEAYYLPFDVAVEKGLLTDYKVVVLAVPEELANSLDLDGEVEVDQACKILGCWKGLVYHGADGEANENGPLIVKDFANMQGELEPLHKAVGFCHSIKSSQAIADTFGNVVANYQRLSANKIDLNCSLQHVDGTMNSQERHKKLRWLSEGSDDECKILTNARCLAEGVDVPALDGIIFFSPRKSKIDIVQAVGRVMRKFEGKKYGYIILPIVISAGKDPEDALNNSKFDVIWDVLQALRSHDRRIDARINAINLPNKDKQKESTNVGEMASEGSSGQREVQGYLGYSQLQEAIYTKLVKRCGDKAYWDIWAEDVAKMAQEHIKHLKTLISENSQIGRAFAEFHEGLKGTLNPNISEDGAVEMITQHIITVPIFNVLFKDFQFKDSNPVSIAMERFLDYLPSRQVTEDEELLKELKEVYASIERRAKVVTSAQGRQNLIKELYEEFFSKAFRATKDKLGIVYTPAEVVDHILYFTNAILREKFQTSLAEPNVHILDGFAGTGTFIAHLISDPNLIDDDHLLHKYTNELHSNEILLLAYYIMVVNIEQAFHQRFNQNTNNSAYLPFEGAVLTDTFQMEEHDDDDYYNTSFPENSTRAQQQRQETISVIIGNPPYSAGQKSANDNNQNDKYPHLDERIAQTYASEGKAANKNSLYDSYIRAFRWASDRLTGPGVICFVTNAGWLRSLAMDGFRKHLVEEFDELYIFDLRGNQRTKGEESRKEGGKIFGGGSRAPIAITLLVKKGSKDNKPAQIYYYDVGDYQSREAKLQKLREATRLYREGVPVHKVLDWQRLIPDKHNDWLDQRSGNFEQFLPIAINKDKEPFGIFTVWSRGLATARDTWTYNFNLKYLRQNIEGLIGRMNGEIGRVNKELNSLTYDAKLYSWNRSVINAHVLKGVRIEYRSDNFVPVIYRPFCRQFVYFDRSLNDMTYQCPRFFPIPSESANNLCVPATAGQGVLNLHDLSLSFSVNNAETQPLQNMVIAIPGKSNSGFSTLASKYLPDLHFCGDAQCFPYYHYAPADIEDQKTTETDDLFSENVEASFPEPPRHAAFQRYETITDETLAKFKETYPNATSQCSDRQELTKLDIFCYIYAIFHHPEYRERFAANLDKELPRIPLVERAYFESFVQIGRKLLRLHVNYEEQKPYKVKEVLSPQHPEEVSLDNPGKVTKLSWVKKRDEKGKSVPDYTRLIYNEYLTLEGLPEDAQRYTINGRSAIDWIIDQYQVKVDKDTEIVKDPNEFAPEKPRYIVDLIEKVVTVAMETLKLVDKLKTMCNAF